MLNELSGFSQSIWDIEDYSQARRNSFNHKECHKCKPLLSISVPDTYNHQGESIILNKTKPLFFNLPDDLNKELI